MITRKVENSINNWIKNSSKAMLVSGARQVGKTYTIRQCLKNSNYLEINLIQQPELKPLLEKAMSVDDLIVNLSALTDYNFIPNETILFIDEVQEIADIVTRIKFWVDDGRFKYILSGSLLGIELKNLRSAPVGYLEEIQMYPLDFEEFLLASGVTEQTIGYLKKCFNEKTPIGDIINNKMMEHFRRYLVVGGMPDAVKEYTETGNIGNVNAIQHNIIELYKQDFTKYENKEKKLKLISIYDLMPSELLKQNRRFNYSDLQKGLKFERVESSFLWLNAAGVVISTYNATEPRLSLNQNKKSSFVKLYSSDIGLLTCQYGRAMKASILANDSKVNLGGIYENAVAQELHAHGFQSYYYNSHSIGELDFIIEEDFHVVPIEVKSGKDYTVHSAINKVVSNKEYDVDHAYVFANCDVSVNGKFIYMPIYMVAFINDNTMLPILEKI
ncbi:ATP-binding protein [Butyrivibrio fibrisolvens]|uniref:ATP-binding protein n=1 Tax=Butyrivibrio fibrisolvens TaxID=831 RepID=UPI0004185BDA|nr:AAA family ATPase [Butyrivibrio fibrisolvens]